jgi:protein-L-isoaspartate O-methyltransferase
MDSNTAQLEADPPRPLAQAKARSGLIGLAFTLAVYLSAALLFVVEPMFGKMVLPLLGGSPAVWTTCMLFFQGALLLGYLYAHIGPRWLGLRRHTVVHVGLLAACFLLLPISVAGTAGSFRIEHPTAWLLWVLTLSLGAPFMLLSSTGPLLQVWFSKTSHPEADSPYFLYAASNAGSLLALLSYPFLLEPMIPLRGQADLWRLGYLVLLGLVVVSAACQRTAIASGLNAGGAGAPTARIGMRTMLRWIVLAFVPSSFFMALTTYITTDIAAVPLLWVIPLVLYLLSFTMVFARRSMLPHAVLVRWQPVGLITLTVIAFWGPSASGPWLLPLHLIVFFVTALVCHGELAATKPPPSRLTDFYLCIAIGGVLGGIFNALVAPAVFDSVLEYPLTILIACAVRPRLAGQPPSRRLRWDVALITAACAVLVLTRPGDGDRPATAAAIISSAIVAMVCLRLSRDPIRFTLAIGVVVMAGIVTGRSRSGILVRERNFFGVREVREDAQKRIRVLMHGTTTHGSQSTDPGRRREPLSYYHRPGPVGDIFRALPPAAGRRVAVIGLGAGVLAAYAGAGEEWTFYEIDPDIARVARDTNYFTYLRDTPATVHVMLGDGRLSIAKAPDHRYDLIVLDAFSSDAIPTHLLTLEALSLYRSKLSETGVLVLHLSNRYLDLEPVVGRLIQAAGIAGLIRANTARTPELESSGDPSIWAAIASHSSSLGGLQHDTRWRPLRIREGVALWTDDFSNIFSVFLWSLPRPVPSTGSGNTERHPASSW